MTKLFIFDLGKVLVDFDFQKVFRGLAPHTPRTPRELHDFFHSTPLWDAFERGHMTPLEFFKRLREQLDLDMTFAQFEPVWNDIFSEIPETIELLKTLKTRMPVHLISNVNAMHYEFLEERCEFLSLFDARFPSYQVGLRKPEGAIFHLALKHAGVKPHEAIFIDDTPMHVHGARKVGIHSIVFHNTKQLKHDLNGRINW